MVDKTYTHNLSQDDPSILVKWITINSFNDVSALIKENRRGIWTQVFMVLTIIISIFIGFFVNSKNYLGILILANALMALLVIFSYEYYKARIVLSNNREKIIEGAKKLGLPIK
jgi:hypothetical protein